MVEVEPAILRPARRIRACPRLCCVQRPRLSLGEAFHGAGLIDRSLWLLSKKNRARLAGPRVGAFWRLGDPAWISLPGPAWLGGR